MAVTPITAELLVINTLSTDFPIAGGGTLNNIVAVTPSDGWEIQPESGETFGPRLLFRVVADAGGTVNVTVKAGDRYPGQRVDLGDLVLSVAASDNKYIAIETSRFLQSDGKIIIVPADAGTLLTAIILPKDG